MKTYQGSCHCGAVKFEADIDLSQGSIKCNCSICAKRRSWSAIVQPQSFRLLNGAADLAQYQFGAKRDNHLFCRRCGVHTFGTGQSPRWGDFYAVSVPCLEGVSDEELGNIPITYLDGRHDIWDAPPALTQHL